MKVIRQICYEGTEEWLRKQLSMSMPEGVRQCAPGCTIEVRTVVSELPVQEPFVPVAANVSADAPCRRSVPFDPVPVPTPT